MDTRTADTLASRSTTRQARSSALVTVAMLLVAAGAAGAADYGIGAKKLLLKSSGKIVLVSKEMILGGADPLGGTDSWISFDAGSGPVTLSLPKTLWTANSSGTALKYKNDQAPAGPSVVKIVKAKDGLLKVTGKGLPFAVPSGAATVHVVVNLGGVNTYCMTFAGFGNGTTFLVKDAVAGSCCGNGSAAGGETCDGGDDNACPGFCQSDCTCPTCGDNSAEGPEECDGSDDGACPGNCRGDCTCTVCGDGLVEGTEQCDGTNDSACPGLCNTSCTCNPACETTTGGYCWFRGAEGDSCDATCANAGRIYDEATSTYAGSAGTVANCAQLAGDYGLANTVWLNGSCSNGLGCYDTGLNGFLRCTTPATTSSASQSPGGYRRICACQDPCETTVGGFCWRLGGPGANCNATCAAVGLACGAATKDYAGSAGTLSQCVAVLAGLAPTATSPTHASSNATVAGGCMVDANNDGKWWTTLDTTCGYADTTYLSRRACACE